MCICLNLVVFRCLVGVKTFEDYDLGCLFRCLFGCSSLVFFVVFLLVAFVWCAFFLCKMGLCLDATITGARVCSFMEDFVTRLVVLKRFLPYRPT